MSTIRVVLRAHVRVMALADVAHRYAGVVRGLCDAIESVLPDADENARERLRSAIRDADAQLAATSSALDVALADEEEA